MYSVARIQARWARVSVGDGARAAGRRNPDAAPPPLNLNA